MKSKLSISLNESSPACLELLRRFYDEMVEAGATETDIKREYCNTIFYPPVTDRKGKVKSPFGRQLRLSLQNSEWVLKLGGRKNGKEKMWTKNISQTECNRIMGHAALPDRRNWPSLAQLVKRGVS